MGSSITYGQNISSLRAQRQLGQADSVLSKAYQKLSSGLRINSAGDDAAGLAVASGLNVQAREYRQAVRNVNDGISLVNVLEGALSQLSTITTRQFELATQAANGAYSLAQRQVLDKEAYALSDEYNRIVASTEYNGIKPFSGSPQNLQIMAGVGASGLIAVAAGQQVSKTIGTGDFTKTTISSTSFGAPDRVDAADVNKDGFVDVIAANSGNQAQLYLGQGNGSFTNSATFNSASIEDLHFGDINGDGNIDLTGVDSGSLKVWLGNGSTISTSATSSIAPAYSGAIRVGDVNNDGRADVVSYSNTGFAVYLGSGSGSLTLASSTSVSSGGDLHLADANSDGNLDIVALTGGNLQVFYGSGTGAFRAGTATSGSSVEAFCAGDFTHDGYADILARKTTNAYYTYTGNPTGVGAETSLSYTYPGDFNKCFQAVDFNDDGNMDVAEIHAGAMYMFTGTANGIVSGPTMTTVTIGTGDFSIASGYVNQDEAIDLIVSDSAGVYALTQKTTTTTQTKRYNLLSATSARSAMDDLAEQQTRVLNELGNLGASQQRLETAANTVSEIANQLYTAGSRITDADIASESATLVRTNILQQASAAVLAQANQAPGIALSLLQGG